MQNQHRLPGLPFTVRSTLIPTRARPSKELARISILTRFADTLAQAHVNSINVFALCHHGWLYYDTEAFAAYRHPYLETNLLKEQIEMPRLGIAAPIYISVQRNQQPGGASRVACDGGRWTPLRPGPYEDGFRHLLCLNSPYVAWLKALVSDVMASVPVDGFWFDIVDARDCSCHFCRQGMLAQGLSPHGWRTGWSMPSRFSTPSCTRCRLTCARPSPTP